MKNIILKTLFLLLCAHYGNSAKILALFTAPGRSHHILGSTLLKALAEKGHDVTMVSAFGEKEPPKTKGKYRDIVVPEILDTMNTMQREHMKDMFKSSGMNPFLASLFTLYLMPQLQELVLKNQEVQKLIHSNEKFDLVIVEQFINDAQKALATHFNAPLIVMSTVGANFWINPLVGNPSPPSYIPAIFTDYSVPLSFCDRLVNYALIGFNEIIYNIYGFPKQNSLIQQYIPNPPDIKDVLYNISIVLMNSHPSINQPVPYVPNMIDIGGFHVKPPKKLPEDLQKFLDDATDGVIYFSMGSNLKSADIPEAKRDAILKTFSKLKQKVLWKWEDDVLPGQPSNVKLGKWLPQQDILAHPNVKLFITHGGYLSTTETIYHGVPILAIPIFGDQNINAKNAVNNGYARMLLFSDISEETLTETIENLLNNPKFAENAKYRSKLFHDREVKPMETAIYWIEYVIKHKGAPHLQVAGLKLPWYKYHLLDVMGFLGLVALISLYILRYCLKAICRKMCSRCQNKKQKNE